MLADGFDSICACKNQIVVDVCERKFVVYDFDEIGFDNRKSGV
jgi:hypothetical protein